MRPFTFWCLVRIFRILECITCAKSKTSTHLAASTVTPTSYLKPGSSDLWLNHFETNEVGSAIWQSMPSPETLQFSITRSPQRSHPVHLKSQSGSAWSYCIRKIVKWNVTKEVQVVPLQYQWEGIQKRSYIFGRFFFVNTGCPPVYGLSIVHFQKHQTAERMCRDTGREYFCSLYRVLQNLAGF